MSCLALLHLSQLQLASRDTICQLASIYWARQCSSQLLSINYLTQYGSCFICSIFENIQMLNDYPHTYNRRHSVKTSWVCLFVCSSYRTFWCFLTIEENRRTRRFVGQHPWVVRRKTLIYSPELFSNKQYNLTHAYITLVFEFQMCSDILKGGFILQY